MEKWDAIVVGGGHAGCEAAWVLARRGLATLLVTDSAAALARMSCNPSIGGVGKGHLVREIDALGGLMAKAADRTGIQFRLLNGSRGAAVQGLRCQADRERYPEALRERLLTAPGLEVREGRIAALHEVGGHAAGVVLAGGGVLGARAVLLTTGTFLGAETHTGAERSPGGRAGEFSAAELSAHLRRRGFPLIRLKTGTPPRLHRGTIRWEALARQEGDPAPEPFSPQSHPFPVLRQVPCFVGRTTGATAAVVRANLHRSPLYGGVIQGVGPRYCPSFEDKVVKFPHHPTHFVFLEPDGLESDEIYPNGLSTSLPADVQEAMVRSIGGLEEAAIVRYGYAVEYDAVDPRALTLSLECRALPGLYLAGQVVGTTGYEEAAGLGLYAGLNAAKALRGEPPFRLGREEAYLGVMVEDLVTRGVLEPYRLFTSRAEHRLLLDRHSAYTRLAPRAEAEGLLEPGEAAEIREREAAIGAAVEALEAQKDPREAGVSLARCLSRPGTRIEEMVPFLPGHPRLGESPVGRAVEARIKGAGYLGRGRAEAERTAKAWAVALPADFDYGGLPGLSREMVERLEAARPETLGQASRIPGVTPAALTLLRVALETRRRARGPED